MSAHPSGCAQGSEYEAVVIALMPQHYVMLRRNLLYTAVTRGRKLVVMVGDRDAIRHGGADRTGRGAVHAAEAVSGKVGAGHWT